MYGIIRACILGSLSLNVISSKAMVGVGKHMKVLSMQLQCRKICLSFRRCHFVKKILNSYMHTFNMSISCSKVLNISSNMW